MGSLNDSQVDSVMFQRVIGSLGSALIFPEHADEASEALREPSGDLQDDKHLGEGEDAAVGMP